jgi:hypothetical protein
VQRPPQLLDEPLQRELARSTGPTREMTRRFCVSVKASEASTSKIASTRVSDFCAC